MPQAKDEAGNIWEVDAQGNPIRLVSQGGQPQMPTDPAYAYKGPLAGADLNKAVAATAGQYIDNRVKGATAPSVVAKTGADAQKAVQETRFNGLSPEVYNKALAQLSAANQLDATIAELAGKYAAGPGSTHGLAGIMDYNPLSSANERFNTAANASRGIVRNALGLTGGEANTAAEAQMNLGAYIPSAGQFDGTIEDSITRLAGLRDKARSQAVQTLGGMPDAAGNIRPVTAANAMEQPFAYQGGLAAAPAGSTTAAGNIPPAMQDEYNKYLAAHLGNIDPQDYVAFRMGLDAKYGFGTAGAWKNYLDEAQKFNAATKAGGRINTTIPAPDRKMSQTEILRNDAVNNPLGAAAVGFADAGGFGGVSALAGDKMDALREASPANSTGMMLGSIGGAIGATSGLGKIGAAAARKLAPGLLRGGGLAQLARNIATDATYGGIYGGVSAGDPLTGAVASAVGSGLGNVAGKGLGAAVGGIKVSPQVEALRRLGIPLTVGRTIGGVPARIEDAATSLPAVGDMIGARQLDSINWFNNAAFQAAGAPIGADITATGRAAVGQLNAAKSQAYRSALDPVTIDAADPAFAQNIGQVRQAAMGIPNVNGAQDAALAGLDHRITGAIDPNTATISGRNFQEAYRGLARTGRERASSDYGHEVGQVMGQGQDALATALESQNPGAYDAFLRANAANRNLNIIADAVNAAKNQDSQLFNPSQLNTAVTNSGKKFGSKVTAAIGDSPLGKLADLGQGVIPSKLPDSGTARRIMQAAILTGLTGAGAAGGALAAPDNRLGGAGGGSLAALAALAALTVGGTRSGQKFLTKALVDRPDLATKAGLAISRNTGYLGSAAVPLSIAGSR